jgi:hypothetical protein
MKKRTMCVAGLAVAIASLCYAGSDEVKEFRGEIADSQCAMNIHSLSRSHQEMLKRKSMGGTPTSCTLYCIKYMGGSFVLSAKKNAYRLDDQDQAQKFAGQKVIVSGTLDSKTNTIHVVKIETEE